MNLVEVIYSHMFENEMYLIFKFLNLGKNTFSYEVWMWTMNVLLAHISHDFAQN